MTTQQALYVGALGNPLISTFKARAVPGATAWEVDDFVSILL